MTELHVVHAILKTVITSSEEDKTAANEEGEISMASSEDGKTEVLNLKISKTSDPDKFDGILSCLERLIGPLRNTTESNIVRSPFGASFGRNMSTNADGSQNEKASSTCCSCSHNSSNEPKKTEADIDERDTKWPPAQVVQAPQAPQAPPIPMPQHHHCNCQHMFTQCGQLSQMPGLCARPSLPGVPPPGSVPFSHPPPIILAPRAPPPPLAPLPVPPFLEKARFPLFDIHRPPPPLPRLPIMAPHGPNGSGGDGPRIEYPGPSLGPGGEGTRIEYQGPNGPSSDGPRYDCPQYDGPMYGNGRGTNCGPMEDHSSRYGDYPRSPGYDRARDYGHNYDRQDSWRPSRYGDDSWRRTSGLYDRRSQSPCMDLSSRDYCDSPDSSRPVLREESRMRDRPIIREESRDRSIVREDSMDRHRPVIREESRDRSIPREYSRGRSGTVIREESRERRSSAVIREESRERRSSVLIREESRERRSSVLIREESRERRSSVLIREESRERRSSVVIKEDRRGRTFSRDDRRSDSLSREDSEGRVVREERGRTGAVIREECSRDRQRSRGRSPRVEKLLSDRPRLSSPLVGDSARPGSGRSSPSLSPSPPNDGQPRDSSRPISVGEVESRDRRSESRTSRDGLSRQDSLRSCDSQTSSRTRCDVSTVSSALSRDRNPVRSLDETESRDPTCNTATDLIGTDNSEKNFAPSSDESPDKGSELAEEALAIIRKTGRSRQRHQNSITPSTSNNSSEPPKQSTLRNSNEEPISKTSQASQNSDAQKLANAKREVIVTGNKPSKSDDHSSHAKSKLSPSKSKNRPLKKSLDSTSSKAVASNRNSSPLSTNDQSRTSKALCAEKEVPSSAKQSLSYELGKGKDEETGSKMSVQSESLSLPPADQSQCNVVHSHSSTDIDSLDLEVNAITEHAPPPSRTTGLRKLPSGSRSRSHSTKSNPLKKKSSELKPLIECSETEGENLDADSKDDLEAKAGSVKPKADDSVFKIPPSIDQLTGLHRRVQSREERRPRFEKRSHDDLSTELAGRLSPRSTISAESGFVECSEFSEQEPSVADGPREMLKRKYWETEDTQQRKRSRTESPRRRRSLSPPDRRPRLNGDRSRNRYKNRDLIRAQSRSPSPDTEDDMFSLSPHPVKPDDPLIETDIEWIRCSPADLYYEKAQNEQVRSSTRLKTLETKFETDLVKRASRVRSEKGPYVPPPRKPSIHLHCHSNCTGGQHTHATTNSSDSDSDSEEDDSQPNWMEALERKISHPHALHNDLWFNDLGEMNDGPECRCSRKSRESGIRHSIYPGETELTTCVTDCNNTDKLYHYRLTVSPTVNFLSKDPTVIEYDGHDYIFEGFSLFSHYRLENIPICKVIRFNIEYSIHFFKEIMPENFTIRSLDLVTDYMFNEILELYDLDWHGRGNKNGCRRFHIMPRFARDLPENGKELLSVSEIMRYLLQASQPLVPNLADLSTMNAEDWQAIIENVRGMIVTFPGMKPSSIRVDQLDRKPSLQEPAQYPLIVHFGVKPTKLSYAGNPSYQRAWKQYMKYKHLLANKPKVTSMDKEKLRRKEEDLEEIRTKSSMKREVTVEISSKNFVKTGIRADMCQHALLLPVLIAHLRFHRCVTEFEEKIDYRFNDRTLIQRALTHPSYRVNFGTNPDHARNSLSNCGIRQPEFGDRKIHHINSRKKGINTLINIMSRMGHKHEKMSEIQHYEGLEFLGDAVVEFITSIHLFYMFPEAEEGGLATYRAAIVQNQHLAVMADRLRLQDYMLYAHGPDLCHESHLKHAMANCLEALMGALFLDSNIEVADRIFARTLFAEDELFDTWKDKPPHPLQADEPRGDRHWVKSSPALQKLLDFEDKLGLKFNHVRLLARSFTPRNVGYNSLTLGHNQRLEFLGDTVLQLIVSEYLFKHFPEHHEGHLSLLRSSLVNNRTQSIVADDLGMTEFIINMEKRDESDLKMKEKADLLEAFIGSLYVDSGLDFCIVFCEVCFFPRLKRVILNQDWNDPKSQLQQCCLTLRELDGGEPFIPTYKMLESAGPTNTRTFKVAVYWQGERLATGVGQSIQRAEMNAAYNALTTRADAFPQLKHQKRFIEKKYRRYKLTESDVQLAGFKKEDRIGCGADGKSEQDERQQQMANERWDSKRREATTYNRHHNNNYSYFHREKYTPNHRGGHERYLGGGGGFRGPYAPRGFRGGFRGAGRGGHWPGGAREQPQARARKEYPRAYRSRSRSKSQSVERAAPKDSGEKSTPENC